MASKKGRRKEGNTKLSDDEAKEVGNKLRPTSPMVYEIVRAEGEEELRRPLLSLWWSGLAAGIAISMSVVAEGLLRQHLPETPWRPLVENFGYCVGFVIVILARFQLFTENTITAVLPLVAKKSTESLIRTARLWGIVLAANIVGTLLFALAAVFSGIFTDAQLAEFMSLARHFMDRSAAEMLLQGVPAGFLIATAVWMMPNAEGSEFWVIVMVTYLIALGDMTHVVAGSSEALLLLVTSEIGASDYLFTFFFPALMGNVIGGTALFTLLAYGQVKEEL